MQQKNHKLPPLPSGKLLNIELNAQKMHIRSPYQKITHSIGRISSQQKNAAKRWPLSRSNSKNSIRVGSAKSISRDSSQSRNLSRQSRNSSASRQIRYKNNERSESPHYNLRMRMSMPSISAKSWSVYQLKQQKYIYGKRNFKKREIASLTKIMNFITIINLLEEYQLSASKIRVRVSRQASCITGTTAQLRHDIEISLNDLYYGMMLPSGNDAAYQIAQIGGAILLMLKENITLDRTILYDVQKMTNFYRSKANAVPVYLAHMNKVSKTCKMINSNFANPHGLSNTNNYSTADDVCKLTIEVMKNQTFREVVGSQFYECTCRVFEESEQKQNLCNQMLLTDAKFTLKWQNTNKMLKDGWTGIKTGITPNAGPCLAATVKKNISGKEYQFAVVVINSSSMEVRWKQVREIVDWVVSNQMYI